MPSRPPVPPLPTPVEVGEAYAREAFRRLERDPRNPDALFALAVVLGVAGRRAEAIQTLTLLAEVAHFYPGLWRFKSRMYREVGDERMAALCAEAATRFAEKDGTPSPGTVRAAARRAPVRPVRRPSAPRGGAES